MDFYFGFLQKSLRPGSSIVKQNYVTADIYFKIQHIAGSVVEMVFQRPWLTFI